MARGGRKGGRGGNCCKGGRSKQYQRVGGGCKGKRCSPPTHSPIAGGSLCETNCHTVATLLCRRERRESKLRLRGPELEGCVRPRNRRHGRKKKTATGAPDIVCTGRLSLASLSPTTDPPSSSSSSSLRNNNNTRKTGGRQRKSCLTSHKPLVRHACSGTLQSVKLSCWGGEAPLTLTACSSLPNLAFPREAKEAKPTCPRSLFKSRSFKKQQKYNEDRQNGERARVLRRSRSEREPRSRER